MLRREAIYDGRVERCYAQRWPHIDAMFCAAVARAPQAEALSLGEARLSYRALDAQVDRVAANLLAAGIGPGERVALLLGNCFEFVLAVLGCARAGIVSVPMNPRQRAPETAFMLNQCGAAGLVHEAALAEHVPPPGEIPTVRQLWSDRTFAALLAEASAPPPCPVAETDTFCLLYTSGTTGRPKGAMLTHLGVIHSVKHFIDHMELRDGECALLAVPASHVTGLVAIILAMIGAAGRTVLMPAFKARDYLALASRERATMTIMVPAMYNLCLLDPEFERFDLSSWRIGGFGGAPMPEATIAKLAAQVPTMTLVNAYGSTETTSPATMLPLGDAARRPDSVGKTVHCAEIVVMDDHGREVAPGEAGELWIAGPMVVPGYWDNPEANRTAFAGRYWKSGDIGSIDAEGYVRVFDRKKDMINRAGYKVYSIEVENELARHAGVLECAVTGYPDPVLGERVQAFVLPREPGASEAELKAHCAARLSDYKVPDRIVFVHEPLPRNPNGKVIKTALRARAPE